MGDDCVTRNNELMSAFQEGMFIDRINILKEFVNDHPSIDLGCGAFMPKLLGTTHACDDSLLALKFLLKKGWNGDFKQLDVSKKLPYFDKQFRCAVCSEVIEHFKTEEDVTSLFREIDRISEKWVVTTPSAFFDDPDHTFYFYPNKLFEVIPFEREKFIIYRKGVYYYITNDIERMGELMKKKWKKK